MFKTFENYVKQFEIFINSVLDNGVLIYNKSDNEITKLVKSITKNIKLIPYSTPVYKIKAGTTYLDYNNESYKLKIFGDHNLQNIAGAMYVCNSLGINTSDFCRSITSFKGASNRLELIHKSPDSIIFKDFAHSPSKVKATAQAIRKQFPEKRFIACFELHTYSSLNPIFLSKYKDTLKNADECYVYYSEKNMKIKRLEPIDSNLIIKSFNHVNLSVIDNYKKLKEIMYSLDLANSVLVMMSSGKFGGLDLNKLK